jgi:hypothetical protein
MLFSEHRNRVLSILLLVQGALILVGAVLLGFSGSVFAPLDNVVGTDASVAAVVLGAALVLAFRTPVKTWINLAIMYEVLTIVAQLWKVNGNFGTHLTWATTVVSAIFLAAFVLLYPRGESMEVTHQH